MLTFNLGQSNMNDHEIDELLTSMGETDYTPEQYDFFYRNCNHFCDDLSQRLTGEMASVRTAASDSREDGNGCKMHLGNADA